MADSEDIFPGFPTCLDDGFTPFLNKWFDIIMQIDNVAEMKVVLYVMRHTWGYQNRDGERERTKKIALDEFAHGRKRRDGSRIDNGTKLAMSSIQEGLKRATEHEYLIVVTDYSDLGRVKKYYGLKLLEEDEKGEELDYRDPVVDSRNPVMNNRSPVGQNSDSGSPTEKETQREKPQKETMRENVALNAQTSILIEKTLQYIKKKEQITYAQLEQFLHRYMEVRGKRFLWLTGYKNAITWNEISDEFSDMILQLQASKKVIYYAGTEEQYAKGRKPKLPVAIKREDHEEQQWHPMMIKYNETQ